MAQYERSFEGPRATDEKSNTNELFNPGRGFAAVGVAAQSAMRCNMELVSLASRRARAQMDLPRKAMACRNAVDFGQLGANFWREAFQDYMDCNQRLMASWTQTMSDAGQGALARAATDFARSAMQPMAKSAEQAGEAMIEHPTEPWAWWRTDVKGLKPSRNGMPDDSHGMHGNA
jgi:hypothetical protein